MTFSVLLLGSMAVVHAQHGHINAGVLDTDGSGTATAGDQLAFKNADVFAYDFVANSGYTLNLPVANVGGIATYYGGTAYHSAWTPTALSGNSGKRFTSLDTANVPNYLAWEGFGPTSNGTGPVAGAAEGSYLRMTLVSIELLSGNATSFSIWGGSQTFIIGEWSFAGPGFGTLSSGANNFNLTANNTRIGPGDSTAFPDPTLPAGNTYPGGWSTDALAAGFRWNVPDPSDFTTAVDPFGHIHGRNFATNSDGDFRLIWQVTDDNGIHAASDLFTMRFQAVPEPSTYMLLGLAAAAALYWRRRRASNKS
jgi:hypothetical protein